MKKQTLFPLIAVIALLGAANPAFALSKTDTPTASQQLASVKEVLNLNTATAAQLTHLPGIGQKKAEAIVQYREKMGKFLEVEQLSEVKGIGAKMVEKLRDQLEVK